MLESFKPQVLTVGGASISVTSNGVTFSKAAILKLGRPEYVVLLVDEDGKRIAIQRSDDKTDLTTPFLNPKKANVTVRWNNSDLLQQLSDMMEWDLSKAGSRINGEFLADEKAILFDLKKATLLDSKSEQE